MQEHGQAVDPNLVQLAAAYREAKAQLGDDAVLSADGDSAGEEDVPADVDGVSGVAEDAHEGLNPAGKPRAHVRSAGSIPSRKRSALPAQPQDSEKLRSAHARSNGLQAHARQNPAGHTGPGRSFIPADTFSGARPGYAFQTGSQGTGYYRDAVGAAAVSRSRRMAIGAGELASDSQDKAPMSRDGSAAVIGDGNADRRGRHAGRKADADDSDSEDDRSADGSRRGSGTGIGQKARGGRKALPGRLRKKLAREREKHGSKVLH